jgi:hypothetical protein
MSPSAQSRRGYLLLSLQNTEKYLPTLPHDCNYSAETVQTIDMDAVYLQRSAAMGSELHSISTNITTLKHHQLLPSSSP